ncbi:helix-turn-helix transcriptional regulator [Chitinophaga defluvii]|uniref:Helix-turn-helix transcriptional regulator n=1 Tax=Chitinophaga defluvii TaxID=3163343 RepID=A0ABV2TAW0_9BACT
MTVIHYNRIKAVLAEKGKSNIDLARALQVAEQTVSLWCTNRRQPPIERLYAISQVLKVNIRDLLVPTHWEE